MEKVGSLVGRHECRFIGIIMLLCEWELMQYKMQFYE